MDDDDDDDDDRGFKRRARAKERCLSESIR